MTTVAAAAVGVAALSDAVFGELPDRYHPVVAFGSVIEWLDRDWRRPDIVGVGVAMVLPLLYGLLGALLVSAAIRLGSVVGALVAAGVLFTTFSIRTLLSAGGEVIDAATRDPDGANAAARALVGRDTTQFGPGAMRSAAVESLAENLADGVVAPLLAFVVGSLISLPVAAGAAAWIKGVNTLDSMLGYRDHPMGWAGARLDDLAMWVPARLSALLIGVSAVDSHAVFRGRRWANAPSSPNSGWPMATMAATLDVTLVKPGAYALNPGAGLPTEVQAYKGLRIVRRAGIVTVLLAGVIAWW